MKFSNRSIPSRTARASPVPERYRHLVTPGCSDCGDIPESVDPFERMETPLWMLSAIVPPREKDAPSDHHRPYKNFRVYEAFDAQGVRWIRCQYRSMSTLAVVTCGVARQRLRAGL